MTPSELVRQYRGDSVPLPQEVLSQLDEPSFRADVLHAIHRDPTINAAGLLRIILKREVAYRRTDGAGEYFENLYWCAFLLWRVGDVRDVLALWQAKQTNFDTACGLDVQCLVGAGVNETVAYLRASPDAEAPNALDYLLKCREAGDFAELEDWSKWRSAYFDSAAGRASGTVDEAHGAS
jgi:hypothetical protein